MAIKSVYKRGAEDGLLFGLYISILAILFFIMSNYSWASVPLLLMILGIPFVIFKFQRRCLKDEFGKSDFATLWMLGILISIFGSLICAVTSYVYMEFINHTFMYDQVNIALELYKGIPEFKNSEMVTMLETAVKQHQLPSAIDYVIQMIWLTSFMGSIISLITSSIAKAIPIKTNKQ